MNAVDIDGAIFVADAGNNRIMVWRTLPRANGAACDFVLGQADMTGLDHNRAAYYPTASTLNMPYGHNRWSLPARDSLCWQYGVAACDNTLIVADSGNNRVLMWEAAP